MSRRICIVTNYNYGDFIGDCLHSIFSQTTSFDLVIAIDDGSTDASRGIISEFAQRLPNLMPLLKDNGGQLSCFNATIGHIRPDDFIWLIDSDDVFPTDYVEATCKLFINKEIDCIFVRPILFSHIDEAPRTSRSGTEEHSYFFPTTSAVTRAAHSWFGTPTSCISMRGATWLSILPYPHEMDWRTRADDVLVFASSIGGARKLYAPSLGVGYRSHGSNNFLGKAFNSIDYVSREFRLERLFGWYENKWNLRQPSAARVLREIRLVPQHLRKDFSVPSPMKFILDRFLGSLPSVLKQLVKG